jgi:predicted small lipoprotein YifL
MSRNKGLRRVVTAAILFGGALTLAGCGKQGVLEQPPPLFGTRAKAEYAARKAQEARDDTQRSDAIRSGNPDDQSAGDNAPLTRRDVKDPSQVLVPASRAPLNGAPNPMGTPVQAKPSF